MPPPPFFLEKRNAKCNSIKYSYENNTHKGSAVLARYCLFSYFRVDSVDQTLRAELLDRFGVRILAHSVQSSICKISRCGCSHLTSFHPDIPVNIEGALMNSPNVIPGVCLTLLRLFTNVYQTRNVRTDPAILSISIPLRGDIQRALRRRAAYDINL